MEPESLIKFLIIRLVIKILFKYNKLQWCLGTLNKQPTPDTNHMAWCYQCTKIITIIFFFTKTLKPKVLKTWVNRVVCKQLICEKVSFRVHTYLQFPPPLRDPLTCSWLCDAPAFHTCSYAKISSSSRGSTCPCFPAAKNK